MKENIYEEILDRYSKDINGGREYLFEKIPFLMRRNPLLKHKFYTYTKDDIYSESLLLADGILLRKDIPPEKKISKLWYLFNKGGGYLYNKLNQYSSESYTIDDIRDNENRSYDMDIDMLEYVLTANRIITPIEATVLEHKKQGRGLYETARLMQTSYYNVKQIMETLTEKIKNFYKENDINESDE